MFHVDQPTSDHCVATARHEDPEGFVQLGDDQYGSPVCLSGQGVRDTLQFFGHASKEDHQALQTELEATKAELAEALESLEDAERTLQAIDLLESEGFRSRKRPGPPKQKATV